MGLCIPSEAILTVELGEHLSQTAISIIVVSHSPDLAGIWNLRCFIKQIVEVPCIRNRLDVPTGAAGRSRLSSRTMMVSHFIMMRLFKVQLVDALYRPHQKLDAIALGAPDGG